MQTARVAIVTGAGRGIGAAIAARLAADGAIVVCADIDADEAKSTAAACGNDSVGLAVDVSSSAACEELIEQVARDYGQLHVLVNNAGVNRDAMLHKMTDDQWDQVIAVDLSGVFYMTRAISRPMRTARYGRIVNIASASWLGNIGQTNYAAAKAGVVGLTRSVAKELARFTITANAICPGFIDTPMTQAMPESAYQAQLDKIPLGRIGEPSDVANTVAFLAGDDSAYVTGEVIDVGGGYRI
jgi:NAD(P)-dependent dehydrogenase (short-subunit alcohol dehydrogenase family)